MSNDALAASSSLETLKPEMGSMAQAKLLELFEQVLVFIQQGGPVVPVILGVCLLLWVLIIERFWFMRFTFPGQVSHIEQQWHQRSDKHSWLARTIRESLISEVKLQLHMLLPLIKVLIALCPMLGLLGTVTGMVAVFEVIAVEGNSDAQAMAQGVYRATIPTMVGLVVSLSGLYFAAQLQSIAERRTNKLADRLLLS